MFTPHFFLTVILVAVAVIFIQWFFVGFLFHKYQALTPSTWRKETYRSYTASMALSLLFAFMFVLILSYWRMAQGSMDVAAGMKFGLLFWLAFALPSELTSAIFVNYAPMFVFGKCFSAMVEFVAAGAMATLMG